MDGDNTRTSQGNYLPYWHRRSPSPAVPPGTKRAETEQVSEAMDAAIPEPWRTSYRVMLRDSGVLVIYTGRYNYSVYV